MTDMQSQADVSFVRQELVPAAPPPMRVHGVWPWMRANLFGNGIGDSILTIVGVTIALVGGHPGARVGLHQRRLGRHPRHLRRPDQWRLLGLREGQLGPVHLRPLS